MPLIRLELKNEYGLGDRKLLCAGDSKKDDPKNILEGISVAGLAGILRQLGDLAEFAADVFHDQQEQVVATSSRWEKISYKIQSMESKLPSLEKAIQGQRSCIHYAYIPGSSWHANVLTDKSKLITSHLPKFMIDLYEECRSPPQLHLLDKFDSSGHGACSERYSDPSYFKKALASPEPIIVQKGRRKKKKRRSKLRNGLQYPVCTSQCSNSTQHASPNVDKLSCASDGSFSKSTFSNTNSKFEMDRESIHLESELKSTNIFEKHSVIPCLESDDPSFNDHFESESNHTDAFDSIVHIEPKHDIADDDSRQQITPTTSSVAILETNLEPDLEGESLHLEPELKSSNTFEQFPLIPFFESADSNCTDPIETESNASNHITCSETKQDTADDDSQQKTEVVKLTCTNLHQDEALIDNLNLDSLHFAYLSSSGNENPQFKIDEEEDSMFELTMEPVSQNGKETKQVSNDANMTTCDLKTSSLEETLSKNMGEQPNSLSSYDSSIIDKENLQNNDETVNEIMKSQNHSSDNFNPPAVCIWTNGNIFGLEPSKPPDFKVKADSEAPTVEADSGNNVIENSVSFSGLANKLLPYSTQKKKLVANSCLSTQSLFINADFMKLQEIVYHNNDIELPKKAETNENMKVGPCSPPLECMKFSFLPMNGLKETLLNLEYSGSNMHVGFDDIKYCYHSFHLVPESSICMQDSGLESDDDTFCRSSIYSDDDVFSYKSKSSSELCEEDDQSQFQKGLMQQEI